MSILTPEVKRVLRDSSRGHVPIFFNEYPLEVRGEKHIAMITLMIRLDNSVYYRCMVDRYKVLDVERIRNGAAEGWFDLDLGMTVMSRKIGSLIEKVEKDQLR